MMKTRDLLLVSLFFLIAGCATVDETEDEMLETEDNEELSVVAENLDIPWAIAKSNDVFYITEREGTIMEIKNEETVRQDVHLKQELSTAAEAGLLGLVLDPNFAENQKAFAYYTYQGESGPTNRIVRLILEESQWSEQELLLDDIPSGDVHHGGRLAIGPDEKLYATTGDAFDAQLAQELDSLAGKILRLNLDGTVPADNPFENSYIYSYGHRNPQGLAWLSDGTLYASEHGDQANDEINLIEAGKNYGWPIIEGEEEGEDMAAPIFTASAGNTWAPSGMAASQDKLYVAGLRGNAVYIFDLKTEEFSPKLTEFGRTRDVYIEGDALYFITNNTDGRGDPIKEDDRFIRLPLSELE